MCGDWVLINGTPHKIQAIDSIDAEIQTDDDLYYVGDDRYHPEDKIEGIPLTKEMLDANGFRYEKEYGPFYRSILGSYHYMPDYCVCVEYKETSKGRKICYIYCEKRKYGEESSTTIRGELYVHTLQHALRVVGLSEIADNFKI